MEKEKKVEEQTTEKKIQRNLNESIIKIRVELQNSKLKKSGKNKFAGFDYFELADFLPRLNELMLQENINDRFYIKDDYATLEVQKGDEINTYTMPFVLFSTPLNKSGQPSMQDIQYLGALNTYYKRYLYLNAFGIVENDVIDKVDNDNLKVDEINYRNELVKYCKENNIDMNEIAKDYKINAQSNNEEFKKVLNELDKKIFE